MSVSVTQVPKPNVEANPSLNSIDLNQFANICVNALGLYQSNRGAYDKSIKALADVPLKQAVTKFVSANPTLSVKSPTSGKDPLTSIINSIPNSTARGTLNDLLGTTTQAQDNPAAFVAATYADPRFPVRAKDAAQSWWRSTAQVMAAKSGKDVSAATKADTAMVLSLAYAQPGQGNVQNMLNLIHDPAVRQDMATVVQAAARTHNTPSAPSGGKPFNADLWNHFRDAFLAPIA